MVALTCDTAINTITFSIVATQYNKQENNNMMEAYTGEVFTVSVKASTTGLDDTATVSAGNEIKVSVIKPDGSAGSEIALTEVGANKIYNGSFTPDNDGTWYLTIVSPVETAINGRVAALLVKPTSKLDLGGSGFNSATDSLSALSDKIDIISSAQTSGVNGFIE